MDTVVDDPIKEEKPKKVFFGITVKKLITKGNLVSLPLIFAVTLECLSYFSMAS
jgi:hypothetical protein